MKYCAFFSIILLSSSLMIAEQEGSVSLQELEQSQIKDMDVQLPRNEPTQELIKAMKELWDTVKYEPDVTIKSLLDEKADWYSSFAMERALEISFNLLEEHGKSVPESIHIAFTRSLSKLVSLADDFDNALDCDFTCKDTTMRCACDESDANVITSEYFNS